MTIEKPTFVTTVTFLKEVEETDTDYSRRVAKEARVANAREMDKRAKRDDSVEGEGQGESGGRSTHSSRRAPQP